MPSYLNRLTRGTSLIMHANQVNFPLCPAAAAPGINDRRTFLKTVLGEVIVIAQCDQRERNGNVQLGVRAFQWL
eukprot:scaffold8457_cov146-Skeletonema_marinoi.AAC.5